jgi:hypothetical protein
MAVMTARPGLIPAAVAARGLDPTALSSKPVVLRSSSQKANTASATTSRRLTLMR